MFSTILSGAIFGMHSYLVRVEVDVSQGLPCFVMVGSIGGEVREAGERVRIALKNMGIHLPPMHVAVNFSPADIRKEGTAFDLPVAIALLVCMGKIQVREQEETLFLGELGLNGEVRPVKGVLPIVKTAREHGIKKCVIPMGNLAEASIVPGMKLKGAETLVQLIGFLQEEKQTGVIETNEEEIKGKISQEMDNYADFEEIVGQESVKRAAVLAAVGFHNLLLSGPPGSGKTMAARRLPGILPPLTLEESLEVSSVYSIAGLLDEKRSFIAQRPFMNPHHTVSPQAMTGGGVVPRPGAISLAHRGILFLDEMPEFKRQTLDALRQPLEEKQIHIVRSSGSFVYPADFMLVGAMNSCPCGYYPDKNKCRCTPFEIHQYRSHISGPILDRIDMKVEVPRVEVSQLQKRRRGENSEILRRRVMAARERQEYRYRDCEIRFNAELNVKNVDTYCRIGEKENRLLQHMFLSLNLSVRAYHRLLKVARTIADVEECEAIKEEHLAEAICYFGEGENGTNG